MTRGQESLVIDMLGDAHAGGEAHAPRDRTRRVSI